MERGPDAGGGSGSGRRRGGIALVLVGLIALAIAGALAPSLQSRAVRPNIVLIVWDTCRGDRLAVNGYPRPTTPLLADLAATGAVFRRCYTPAPWTAPAHASLFTGVGPWNHRMREGMGDRIRPGLTPLAATLAAAGYETVAVSANPVVSTLTGLTDGFEFDFQAFRSPEHGVAGEAVRDRLRAWALRRRAVRGDDRPVFLFVNLMETHLPYVLDGPEVAAVHGEGAVPGATAAAAAVGDLEAKLHLVGRRTIPAATIDDLSRAYDGAVRRTDRLTAGILDDLEGEGLLEGAFVAICGDHGENLGEHGELNHALSVHDPVLHVPLVVRWPGRLDDGRVVDTQVRLQDLYATVLEAAGVAPPQGCGADSVSLGEEPLLPRTVVSAYGPMARSQEEARVAMPGAPEAAFAPFRYRFLAVQAPADGGGRLKLVRVTDPEGADGPRVVREALYDLAADPGEERNLLGPGARPEDMAAAERLRAAAGAGL